MKFIISIIVTIFVFLFANQSLIAQPVSSCFEIEGILIDACGNDEGNNEMVRFRVGPNNLHTSNLTVNWPTAGNPWGGVCQNNSTAAKVAQLNNTIAACGYLKEPVGGILPANSQVLLISGMGFDPTNNSFEGLADTVYIIFNCASPTSGNFANAGTGVRTLSMFFSSPNNCSDQVSYDRSKLFGGDGAAVSYTADGTATYFNNGCAVPFSPLSAEWTAPGPLCAPLDLAPLVSGNTGGTFSGQGVNGTIFNPQGLSGQVDVTYTVGNGNCEKSVTHAIVIAPLPEKPQVIDTVLFCKGINLPELQAQASGQIKWYTDSARTNLLFEGTSFHPDDSLITDYYIINLLNGCESEPSIVHLKKAAWLSVSIQAGQTAICPGATINLTSSLPDGNHWSTGDSTVAVSINQPGIYRVEANGYCNTAADSVEIKDGSVKAGFSISPEQGDAPLVVSVNDHSEKAIKVIYYVNGSIEEPDFSFPEEGVYTITQVVKSSAGCEDSSSVQLIVNGIMFIEVPNSFSPNGDGFNDVFGFKTTAVKEIECSVFNRWGNKINSFSGVGAGWDGLFNGKPVPEGTYFFVLTAKSSKGEVYKKNGTVTLLR